MTPPVVRRCSPYCCAADPTPSICPVSLSSVAQHRQQHSMLRRRLLNPRCASAPIPWRHGNRRSAPCGSIHGNRRSAPCAATADRGGRDVTASASTKSSKPPPPPPPHPCSPLASGRLSRIRRPDKLPPPRYLRAQNRSDATGSGYAVAPSSLSSRSSKDSRSDISSPLAAASSASSSRQRSLSSSAPKTRSQLGEAVQACGDVLVLSIVRESPGSIEFGSRIIT